MATALLFDRDQVDELEDWRERLPRLGRSSILWIDFDDPDEDQVGAISDELGLASESADLLLRSMRTPKLTDFGSYLHVTVCAPSDPERRDLHGVSCLVSERWIVTAHDAPVEVLETFRERASGSGSTGDLNGPEFLADIVEWMLASYLSAFEEIERSLEDVDTLAMSGRAGGSQQDGALDRLADLRREIGSLRRALTSHREVLLALTRPELDALGSTGSAERFAALRDRLEDAVQAARDSRDALVGSFDLLIASTGQRTNDIMKVLTLVSVLLLPGALIAGVMGMNFKLGLFDNSANFWIVIAVMVLLASSTLVVARVRHWI